jgi:hypothetical protein
MKKLRLLRSVHKGRRMTPRRPRFVAVVPVISNPKGEVIGSAKIEKMHGKEIVHIDAGTMPADTLLRGFSLGEIPAKEGSE